MLRVQRFACSDASEAAHELCAAVSCRACSRGGILSLTCGRSLHRQIVCAESAMTRFADGAAPRSSDVRSLRIT